MDKRKSYILYQRKSGGQNGLVYYVAYWNARKKTYTPRRSTGVTSLSEADELATKWLNENTLRRKNTKQKSVRKNGYIYFAMKETPDNGFYLTKIGKSTNTRRAKELPVPFGVKVLYLKTTTMDRTEIEWQCFFIDKIYYREWFALTVEDLAYIEIHTRDGNSA